MHGLKIYICDSNVLMEGLIASFFRFCRRQDGDSKFWILSDASTSRSLEFAFDFFQGLYEYSLSSNEDILYSKACKKSSWEKFNWQIISYSII